MNQRINDYPSDAAEIARLIRQADDLTAVRLLQVWGAKQRDIGGLKAIQEFGERINAQA
ncbi:MAG TPA: hypothetical protein VF499_04255 [Afipia sp.]